MKNIFQDIPESLPEELFECLVATSDVRIERIVSRGHRSPAKGWYAQEKNEWVLLLQGSACIEFEDRRVVRMAAGDWLAIPAHQKHRVSWTEPEADTIWLGVHY
jgi:cupin 2 domain-containing protein